MKKLSLSIIFIAVLCLLIWQTTSEAWLTAWFMLLFFVGLPLVLFALRDALIPFKPKGMGRRPLLLHTCAVFAAFVGYFVGWMAVDSEHPRAHLHQSMVIVFPLLVYLTPLLMVFHGLPISELKSFYFSRGDEDSDER